MRKFSPMHSFVSPAGQRPTIAYGLHAASLHRAFHGQALAAKLPLPKNAP
jgi:hypothetical protein